MIFIRTTVRYPSSYFGDTFRTESGEVCLCKDIDYPYSGEYAYPITPGMAKSCWDREDEQDEFIGILPF